MKISEFLEIEKKYNLYEEQVCEVHFWNYSRFAIWDTFILKKESNLVKKRNMGERAKKVMKYIYYLMKSQINNIMIIKKADVCIYGHERKVKTGEFFECIYTEKLVELYSNHIVLEDPYEFQHYQSDPKKNVYETDCLIISSYLIYWLIKIITPSYYKKLNKSIKEKIEKPLSEISYLYKINLDVDEIVKYIAKKVVMIKVRRKHMKKLLRQISPQIIVEVVSYGMNRMIINEIALEMGITTIELQHGVMHEGHAAYQYAENITIPQFPQKMFLFSNYCKECAHLPINKDSQKVVGFPYLDENKKKYNTEKEKHKIFILFISQHTIGSSLSACALSLCEILDNEKFEIIYKLHPAEYSLWKYRYPFLKNSKIRVIDSNKESLYEIFTKSSYQVGVCSTALFEGLQFELETFILKTNHAQAMQLLTEMEYATYVEDANELAEVIIKRSNKNIKKGKIDFWEENALQNMEYELNKIIEGKRG